MENQKLREQLKSDVKKWFGELDRLNSEPSFSDREQPITPEREVFDQAPADPHSEVGRRD